MTTLQAWGPGQVPAFETVGAVMHVEADVLEPDDQRAGETQVVFDQQDARGRCRSVLGARHFRRSPSAELTSHRPMA